MKQPFMGFIIGVLLASIWPNLALLLAPIVLVLCVCIEPSRFLSPLLFVLGVIWVSWHWHYAQHNAVALSQGKTSAVLVGEVTSVSKLPTKTQLDFRVQGQPAKLNVSCYRCPLDIVTGEQWQLALRIKPIYAFQNPGGFDYRRWMLAKGYVAQASVMVKSPSNIKLASHGPMAFNPLSDALKSTEFPILRALVLGDKSAFKGEDKRLIVASGISHLFVVSGLHVGIVAGLVGFVFYWLQRPLLLLGWPYARVVAVMSGLSVAVLYGHVTGFQVPASRAVIMLMCGALMLYQTRFTHVLHYYLFALLLVMLIKPLAFMDMGSWLSFSIVLALIMGFSGASRTTWLSALIKAQWLAFCMGGLVLLGFNQALVPASILLNLILVPLFTVLIMPSVVMALMAFWMGVDQGLLWLESGLSWLLYLLSQLESIITWWLPVHQDHRYLFMSALVLTLLPKVLMLRPLALVAALTSVLLPVKAPSEGGFQLTVFDVGQGNAALIKTAHHHVLVDTGARYLTGSGVADFVILPYLRQNRIRHLDMLHVTHSDNDHAGNTALLSTISHTVIQQDSCEHYVWHYDGVMFERFQAAGFTKGNNGSCLLKVTAASGKSVLFTGDIEKQAEQQLVNSSLQAPSDTQPAVNLRANVLIAPHHGSRTSSTDDFLDAVNAKHVIVCAGFLNRYGHPHAQILNKYAARNMTLYTTAVKGSVQVTFPPRQEALVVSTYRPDFVSHNNNK